LYYILHDTNHGVNRTQKETIHLPYAVFDLHFNPKDGTLLAIATSDAQVVLFRVGSTDSSFNIYQLRSFHIHEDSPIPALFLAWTPPGFLRTETLETDGTSIDGFAVAFADGSTGIFSCSPSGIQGVKNIFEDENENEELAGLVQHSSRSRNYEMSSEVWFVALALYHPAPKVSILNIGGQEDTNTQSVSDQAVPFLFTGNDFGTLHAQKYASNENLRHTGATDDDSSRDYLRPKLLDYDDKARHHTAGVTSILPLPVHLVDDFPIILTGSYDEYLRVYHATRRGNVLAEERLGGGVWRLQLLRDETENKTTSDGMECLTRRFLVLASCMHAGTRIVGLTWRRPSVGSTALGNAGQWEIDVIAQFTEHESMNYASDVWGNHGTELEHPKKSTLLCVSTSFYDCRICVWQVDV
jgi:diphthamide biosynthesis protein 7